MLDRVIVAFDGSDLAREALAYASIVCEATGASVLALYAREPVAAPVVGIDPGLGADPGPAIALATAEMETIADERQREAELALNDFADHCAQRGLPFKKQIERGRLINTLTDLASATDLIAVGRKGRFSRAGVGSSTRALVRHSPCPVLVVSGPLHEIGRVLTVFDGTPHSKRALAWADWTAARAAWPFTVLACEGPGSTLDESLESADRLVGAEAQVITFAEKDRSEAALIEYAAEKAGAYALIVMGAYETSWLHELLFGSTTAQALSRVKGPVVLVH